MASPPNDVSIAVKSPNGLAPDVVFTPLLLSDSIGLDSTVLLRFNVITLDLFHATLMICFFSEFDVAEETIDLGRSC